MAPSLNHRQARRAVVIGLACTALAMGACQRRAPLRPIPGPIAEQEREAGPRHRVALLLPLTGEDGPVATSIGNAARLALLDSGNRNIDLTIYDSGVGGAAVAAAKAIADGNRLILGPLLAEEVRAAAPVAHRARVPVIAFSNDEGVAGDGVFILGITPAQSIERVVRHARAQGATRFGALVPSGLYGKRAADAMLASVRGAGAAMTGLQTFERAPAAAQTAARALNAKGNYDAVLIADSGRLAAVAAPAVEAGPRLLGTELWASERGLGQTARLRGAWFAAAPDARFDQLVTRYRARYGKSPFRLGSLGYDAVLLTVRAAREWRVGRDFPARALTDRTGFAGVDGIFRFGRDGVAERALEVREVTASGTRIVSHSPGSFGD